MTEVGDLSALMDRAVLPRALQEAIRRDVAATGAVHVQELTMFDWEQLPAWQLLKPLERRRVLKYVPPS